MDSFEINELVKECVNEVTRELLEIVPKLSENISSKLMNVLTELYETSDALKTHREITDSFNNAIRELINVIILFGHNLRDSPSKNIDETNNVLDDRNELSIELQRIDEIDEMDDELLYENELEDELRGNDGLETKNGLSIEIREKNELLGKNELRVVDEIDDRDSNNILFIDDLNKSDKATNNSSNFNLSVNSIVESDDSVRVDDVASGDTSSVESNSAEFTDVSTDDDKPDSFVETKVVDRLDSKIVRNLKEFKRDMNLMYDMLDRYCILSRNVCTKMENMLSELDR